MNGVTSPSSLPPPTAAVRRTATALRVCRLPGAVLDTAFLPPGTAVVDDAADPDIVALATARRVPAAVQRQIARARRRFGWRPLLVAHYGEIEADPAANLADLDAVFSFAPSAGRNTRHERYWRMPLLTGHVAAREALSPGGLWARPKSRFCNFVVSNATHGTPGVREAFARALMRHTRVDCPGRVLRNVHPLPPNAPGTDAGARAKIEYLASYRFTIAFEHTSADHYLTEKILHALVAGSIPIYWGCPQVAEYYNPDSFVNCHDFPSFDAVIERVLAIEADPARAEAMRRAPLLRPGSRIVGAHADLEARWVALVAETRARRCRPRTPHGRRWLALAGRSLAMEVDVRPRAAALGGALLAHGRRLRLCLAQASRSARTTSAAAFAQLREEARHVRGPRTAARLLAWSMQRLRWLLFRRRHAAPAVAPVSAPATGRRVGAREEPGHRRSGPTSWRTGGSCRTDFDPRRYNPVGWTPNVERRVVALAAPAPLPGRARRAVDPEDDAALRHAHHVVDTAARHADVAARAAALVRLAARGVPVRLLDGDPALRPMLGGELHDLMASGVPLGCDAREAKSIRARRLAHRDHARRRAPWPTVSVLLATRRPERLRAALAGVARQRYPRLELVLALHGDGFGALPRCAGLPVRIVRVDARRPLGAALAAAADLASGELVAKMDDDDLYDADHILDLVLARAYSGAELVGKGPQTVYLAGRDATVRRGGWRAERFTADIAGGALLIAASDLARAGGWRPLPYGVDQALATDVAAAGGAVYRTHGAGFVLVRHGGGHAWVASETRFLADADAVYRGWRPDLAGIADAPPPC